MALRPFDFGVSLGAAESCEVDIGESVKAFGSMVSGDSVVGCRLLVALDVDARCPSPFAATPFCLGAPLAGALEAEAGASIVLVAAPVTACESA